MTNLRRLNKKTIAIAASLILAGVIVGGVAIRSVVDTAEMKAHQTAADGTSPEFRAILPQNTTISELGGWNKQTSPGGETYYDFMDSINGVAIRVSQQKLPENFKQATDDSIAKLAKGYNANRSFDAIGTKVYIGINTKGQQSLIFTRDSLLVFIVSGQTVPDDAWKDYIAKLN